MRLRRKSQLLVMMQGGTGSGKSTFAKALSAKLSAPRLSSDEMGAAMWDGIAEFGQELDTSRSGDNKSLKFNALRYAVGQVLVAGHSVIVDAQHSSVQDRQRFTSLIGDLPVFPVIVWVQTPNDIARDRVLARRPAPGRYIKSSDEIEAAIARSAAKLEMPLNSEYMVTLSGLQPFSQQYADFQGQIIRL